MKLIWFSFILVLGGGEDCIL